jgi:hypothetical protein
MDTPSSTTPLSGTQCCKRALRLSLLYISSTMLLAVPLPSLAAMVYGTVTGCDREITVWKDDNTQYAVVPVQNRAYKVVLPPGSYRAICTDNNHSLTIRSDPSPVRQNLAF